MLRGLGGFMALTAMGAALGDSGLYGRRVGRQRRDGVTVHVLQDKLPEGDCSYRAKGNKRSRRRRAARKASET